MSSSNCCFLTCIQISQEADQVVWYSHLFQNFPQFIVIYTVKGFGIVNKAEIDAFLELSCFFHDPADVGNLISGSSAFCCITVYKYHFVYITWYLSSYTDNESTMLLYTLWMKFSCSPKIHIEAPTPNMMVFEGGGLWELISFI